MRTCLFNEVTARASASLLWSWVRNDNRLQPCLYEFFCGSGDVKAWRLNEDVRVDRKWLDFGGRLRESQQVSDLTSV
ncbi:hypothetical protein JY96_16175 [Aquabacterium sp. NJ1]|nr:hypothetical protein JY96_16175 [Aquabacterium sp. NJ1]